MILSSTIWTQGQTSKLTVLQDNKPDFTELIKRANMVFAERETCVAQRDTAYIIIAGKDTIIAEKNIQITAKDSVIATQEKIIDTKDTKAEEKTDFNKKELKEMKRQRDGWRIKTFIVGAISIIIIIIIK